MACASSTVMHKNYQKLGALAKGDLIVKVETKNETEL
jgi:hypothetical protein